MRNENGEYRVHNEVFTKIEWCWDCEGKQEMSYGYDENNLKVRACTRCNKEYYSHWEEQH
ncbi:MAG: hypothetical protein FH761_16705 [Firmicutes bacterium]|nr:hypothetical protein [Bacillota bacterium]